MTWLLLMPVALAAGMALPTQFAVNTQLRNVVGGPVLAAGLSFFVGAVVLLGATLLIRRAVPDLAPILGAPWWMWTGGLLGAGFVPASVIIYHFGLIRASVHEAGLPRLLGIVLILAGVALVPRF